MDDKKESGGSMIGTIISVFFEIWADILSAVWAVLPKVISFVFWLLAAFIILPAVFIAGTWYPNWQKWGEKF